MQHFRVWLDQFFQHILSEFCLSALMGFVHYHEIPDSLEEFIVLVELASHLLRTTKILHGSEINILAALAHLPFEIFEQFTVTF